MRAFFPVLTVLSAADSGAASAVVKSPGVDGRWYSGPGDWSGNGPKPICEKPAEDQNYGACSTGWTPFNNNCYKLLEGGTYKLTSHFESSLECNTLGAHLATIGSVEENVFVEKICGNNMCWLGLIEPLNSETWQWVDGSEVTYANWADSTINWFGKDEAAAFMNFHRSLVPQGNGKWYGAPHSYTAPFPVCKLDGTVCPVGWQAFTSGCFKLIQQSVSFDQALYLCAREANGATLASIGTLDENKFVSKNICGQNMCWIGCYYDASTKQWAVPKKGGKVYGGQTPPWATTFKHLKPGNKDACMMNFIPESSTTQQQII